MKRFIVVLSLITVAPFAFSIGGNPFGPYLASYFSSALVVAGAYELLIALAKKTSILKPALFIASGAVIAVLVNMTGILGMNLYLAFILGQIFTVALVRWIFVSSQNKTTAKTA